MITFRNVSHRYPGGHGRTFDALTDVTFDVAEGSSVAIWGRSGSGKSTLLNLIAGLDQATAGSVRVAGQDLGAMSERALTRWRGRHVGVVFQFFQLLPTLTVRENLLLAMEFVGVVPRPERTGRIDELLQRVGIERQRDKFPAQLSGGEQQRAAVARALANRPALVVADEPTGNLDVASARAVMNLFGTLRERGVTIVTVTHDEEIAARADRIIALDDGRCVAEPRSTP
ncbi:MAG: ABC transporter ATP-binding protein [Myxococcota bacterium]